MANDERRARGISEEENGMQDGDATDEDRGGKGRQDEDATVLGEVHVPKEPDRHGDEDDVRDDVRFCVQV